MKKGTSIYSKILFSLIIPTLSLVLLAGCGSQKVSTEDQTRIDFVKETLEGYGMSLEVEVNTNTPAEEVTGTFGKAQLSKLLYGKQSEDEILTQGFYKYENSDEGKKEALEQYNKMKESNIAFAEGAQIVENTNSETGSIYYILKTQIETTSQTTQTDDSSEEKDVMESSVSYTYITIILIYDANLKEAAMIMSQSADSSEELDKALLKQVTDLGWNIIE
jgi:hypothetical protein